MKKVLTFIFVLVFNVQVHAGLLYSADGRISVHPDVQGSGDLPRYSVDWRDPITLPVPPDYTGNNGRISADGRVISGQLFYYDKNNNIMTDMRAAIWEQTEVVDTIPYYSEPRLLPSLQEGQFNMTSDMSPTGEYITGHCILGQSTGNYQAVYWDQNRDVHSLGSMYYDSTLYNHSTSCNVRNDNTIFGITWSGEGGGGTLAFIWDEQHGIRYLKDVLEQEYGYNFGDAVLESVHFLDPDGTNIYGNAYNPTGTLLHWTATIPEPATLLILGLGVLCLRHR